MENESTLLWLLCTLYKKYSRLDDINSLYKKKFSNTLELDPSHSNAAHEYNGSVVCSTEYNTIWLENSPLVKMKWVWLIIMPDSSIGFIL